MTFLLSVFCGRSPVDEGNKTSGLKTISINSSDICTEDLSKIPGYAAYEDFVARSGSVNADVQKSSLMKTSAKIDFSKAKVAVVWHDLEYFHQAYIDDYANFYCNQLQSMHESFKGRDPLDFDDVASGVHEFLYYDVVYTGSLKKSGDYVEGTVSVKPGINVVYIGFLNSAGEMFHTTYATYYYLSGLSGMEYSEYADGWDESSSGEIWWPEMYMESFEPANDGTTDDGAFGSYNSFTYYSLPGSGIMIGIPKDYVDYQCASLAYYYP